MTAPAGFFKAFFGACRGRDIFYTLRTHSWKRTLWHLFLLSFITGLIIGKAQSDRVSAYIDLAEEVFTGAFGKEICVSNAVGSWNWICPVKDPLKPRHIALPKGGAFYYTGNSSVVPDSLKNVSGTLVVWSPAQLGVSVPVESGTNNCMIVDTATGRISQFRGTNASLEKIFKETPDKLPYPVESMKKEPVKSFFVVISMLFGLCAMAGTVLWNFVVVLLYTGIFMGMYRLLNGPAGRLRFLTLGQMWKCGIYAAFPAMAVASLFPILELPFFSYETVFMIGLLAYWMAVVSRLERTPLDDEVKYE